MVWSRSIVPLWSRTLETAVRAHQLIILRWKVYFSSLLLSAFRSTYLREESIKELTRLLIWLLASFLTTLLVAELWEDIYACRAKCSAIELVSLLLVADCSHGYLLRRFQVLNHWSQDGYGFGWTYFIGRFFQFGGCMTNQTFSWRAFVVRKELSRLRTAAIVIARNRGRDHPSIYPWIVPNGLGQFHCLIDWRLIDPQ